LQISIIRGQKRKRDEFIDNIRTVINTRLAVDQLKELSAKSTIHKDLASLLTEAAYAPLDVADKLKLGTLRARGGYADVYDGELMTSAVDDSALRQASRNKKQLGVYLRAS
jgi:hypothetical protein